MPKKVAWLVDGMAAMQTLKPNNTYAEWIEDLWFMKLADASEPAMGGNGQ